MPIVDQKVVRLASIAVWNAVTAACSVLRAVASVVCAVARAAWQAACSLAGTGRGQAVATSSFCAEIVFR